MDRIFSNPVNFCPCLTVLFRATHEQWYYYFQIDISAGEDKTYVMFKGVSLYVNWVDWVVHALEIKRILTSVPVYDWWFFLNVCCSSVSNWSVLVLRKRGGREGADLIPPSAPSLCTPQYLGVYPVVVYLSVPPVAKYPLWRWAPISTVAPKLLPIAHTFCHFIHQY